MSVRRRALAWLAAGAIGCGSGDGPILTAPLELAGGRTIPIDQLLRGREQYTQYCRPCHADQGNGRGPAAEGLRPPPRNFVDPVFKFGGVESGSLPPDSELKRIIRRGLRGTAMLPWDISEPALDDILAYIKVFGAIWKEEAPAAPIVISPDPWLERPAEGIARGQAVYHGLAGCSKCHPAYGTREEIARFELETTGQISGMTRERLYEPEAKFSEAFQHTLLPPDFLRHPIKAGETLPDLFRTIAAGIGGTAMPMWKDSLPDQDLWGLAHYVESLVRLRGTRAATALRAHWLARPAAER